MAYEPEHYPTELIESAEALTTLVSEDRDFDAAMTRMCELAVHAIDGAEECSISLKRDTEPITTVGSATGVGRDIDRLQEDTREGPCLSSIEDRETHLVGDLAGETPWPTFAKRASDETGVRSMLSYVLRLGENATASMNMMSTQVKAFTEEDVATGTLFAAQVAVAVTNALGHAKDEETIHQLEDAVKTRQIIGQAVGIMMATRKVEADAAFEILKEVSQKSNLKLRDIAQRVVERADNIT